jgi:hypothetical protein
MKLKTRDQLFNDIIRHGKKHPTGWMASFSKDYQNLSNDSYLFHPNIGLFYLKDYQKNPFQHVGFGGKIARKIDEDLTEELRKQSNNFGIIQGDIRRIAHHIDQGISPSEIIQSMFKGENKGMTMPVKGTASSSSEQVPMLKNFGKKNQKKVKEYFKKRASTDGLYHSYD